MTCRKALLRLLSSALLTLGMTTPLFADKWTAPTPEELSMTLQPEAPGAPAVYLFREEITEDQLHMYSVYVRLKVLNERGKDFANVELGFGSRGASGVTIGDISGRTIEPDGSVVPFTGRPYEKLIVKHRDEKYMAKVFTMPDVRIGSILEYRYIERWDDHYYIPPNWFVQSNLFTRRAHFLWKPTSNQLISNDERGQLTSGISWARVLPAGAEIKETRLPPTNSFRDGQLVLDLNLTNISPAPDEDFMPPIRSFTYRVLFYYTPYQSGEEYWRKEGKYWTKQRDRFIGPGAAVSAAARELTQGATTPDQRLRKLYDAVQRFENTGYTRSHTDAEDKAQGLGQIRTTDDVLLRKRGDGDQLAQLFVGLARAAGFHAYLMAVTNRDRSIFFPAYLSMNQLNDDLAVVTVEGKDLYLDPGTPCVPYGQLAWRHDMAGGLRQTDGGAEIGMTPPSSYTASRVQRVTNLTLAADGEITGTIKMVYMGSPAVNWRHRALAGDEASLRRELTNSLEAALPDGLEVHLGSIDELKEADQPLSVNFRVSGRPGGSTGKRLLLSGELFESRTQPAFPHEKRDIGVYFEYPHMQQDAIRISFPASYAVESLPTPAKEQFQKFALYELKAESTTSSITIRRTYVLGNVVFEPKEYPELRTFYGSFQGKDQQTIVLKQTASQATTSGGTGER